MKKIAITLSAATLLLGGLVGCGVDQQGTTGQGGAGQRGFGYHTTDQRQDTGITGQRAGEGPITDMFTRDDRRGARGIGRDARQPATGLAGERAGMRGAGHGTGMFGGGAGGATGAGHGTGMFGGGAGGATGGGQGTGMFGGGAGGATGGGAGGATGGGQGTGMFGRGTGAGAGMTGHGAGRTTGGLGSEIGRGGTTGHGIAATPGWQGETGYHGGTRGMDTGLGIHGNAGMRGTARGQGQAFGTGDHRGAGIVGNRPGYVDDRGILRERTGRTGMAGLGQGGQRMGHGQGRGHMGGLGFGSREGANGRAGDRVVPGTGMSEFAYPDGQDTNTGQRGQGTNVGQRRQGTNAGQRGYDAETTKNYTTRLADLENVRDSRVIVHGNRVLVGVDADGQDTQQIEQDIRQRLRGMTGDREIIVVSERDQYDQIRTADDRLRAGEPFEEVGATINAMFQDFGRAIQRPFERTR
ncbi:MAG: YhcN/YlaJ family sporulation lipoprotein [Anaerobacillus sp.]|uniref:YhcN/YlaJ family sporulation lipoprotein n=1 Tax=Anaerobacillus sp. TaxID=1872506 RepID=UPI00391BE9CB